MLSFLSFFVSCAIHKNKPVVAPDGFDWQGHRGCRGLRPENSLPAFLYALEFPEVVTLELDLAVTKDGQLIVSHEPFFNPVICRLPQGDSISRKDAEKYRIYEMTASEVSAFDCGSWGNVRFPDQQKMKTYKPTLKEVVIAVREKFPQKAATIRWNIEIKSQASWDGVLTPPVAEFAQLVHAEIVALGISKQCTVQSFDIRALQSMQAIAPEITLAYLIENINSVENNIAKLGFVPAIYSPYYGLVSKKMLKKCHRSGMKVIPWTVNSVPAMRQLIRLGVDGIITDYPNLIPQVKIP